ncbi:MAG: GMC oxidoreductase [Hyphomicrobiaceae bacterium]
MPRLARPLEELGSDYDAVVIGSGYGGGVAASRLARAGKRVCVLERGREVQTGEFPTRLPDIRREMQVTSRRIRTGSETGLYDIRLGSDMHVLVGCGLGGGSLINAGVALRPDPRVFADAAWPDDMRSDDALDEGYRRAQDWLRPARAPAASATTKFQAFAKAGAAVGKEPVVPPLNVAFEDTVSSAGIAQPACTGCGDCCGGCNVGAKTTVALTYLPDAAHHGAHLFTHARVSSLTRARDGRWQVHIAGRTAPLTASLVILAAGTLGSTEILLRSGERGLALSDKLGSRFSANGDIIAFGYGAKIPVNAIGVGNPSKVAGLTVGAVVSGQLDFPDAGCLDNEMHVQEGVLPSALAPILPVLFIPNGRLLGALQSLVTGVYKGPFAGLQTFFAVSHDNSGGTFRLEDDHLQLAWPNAGQHPVYKRLDDTLSELVSAVGGRYVKNPLAGTVMGHTPATAHPLGGTPMGRTRSDGVVDHKCRVFDAAATGDATAVHDGLYVTDGAVIPRSLGVNPLLTITALAERALIHMARDHNFSFSAEPYPRAAA